MSANDWRLARSLADVIKESRGDLGRDGSPELSSRRRNMVEKVSAKADYLEKLSKRTTQDSIVHRAKRELDLALAELDSLEAEIRRQDPRIEELERPAQITLAETQQLLDKESVLLHYFLGKTRSFLWLVTPASLQSFELPAGAELEALARTVYEELSHLTFGMPCPGQDALLALSGALIGDVKNQIANKRLVVVADGALAYLNFSALPDPNAEAPLPGDCHPPLLNSHEVVYLPSATILAVQRKTYAFRPTVRKAIAVFADPVYDTNDSRLVDVHIAKTTHVATTAQPVHDFAASLPERLIDTSREASAIAAIASDWQTEIYLGFSANKKMFSAKAAGDYRVLHLATHGILDSQRPSMSSILLSQYAADGRPQDGYLRLQDIYNLRLKSDLVVLSGCETALGRKLRGEGFIGLTRGFLYAGARTVISSLWRVEDTATAEFMKHFYRSLMQNGAAPAEALRYAQLKMARSQRWQQPYYWAAFVLQGEWRQ
ncbi:MAG: CHAT domain-containing protein [Proteobacteria bacterium]|nr:CHAT domain-containing protein [Pseudomonadota bacterium]